MVGVIYLPIQFIEQLLDRHVFNYEQFFLINFIFKIAVKFVIYVG